MKIFKSNSSIVTYKNSSIKEAVAVLKLEDEYGDSKPVAYFSKKLNAFQMKAIYLECLSTKLSEILAK